MPRTIRFILALALALGLGAASCSRSEPVPAQQAPAAPAAKDPQAARALIAGGAVVLDVRTADEYAEGHLPSAVNVPVQELAQRMAEVNALVSGDKARPVVVYCASGNRASKAKQALEAAGYSRVVNGGGLDDLM
ncbi:MAG TPA: rhodanese-like domain-containing protein [Kofleriaceae bacterium]|nr:rhodanese-like domain-containing protein [Kofleriaceae bacterium]